MIDDNILSKAIINAAKGIHEAISSHTYIEVDGDKKNIENPHYFEIYPFDKMDDFEYRVYAIDGSLNSANFVNGISISLYCGGYVCFQKGKQIRVDDSNNPLFLGKKYYPNLVLSSSEDDLINIYEELISLDPVKKLISFFDGKEEEIFPYKKETLIISASKLLSFAQEILEWSLIYEIVSDLGKEGDFILKDGTLRSNNIKQEYIVKLCELAHNNGIRLIGVTKNSALKIHLSSSYKKIDSYLEENLKFKYPFKDQNRKKLCCWFEISDDIIKKAYPEKRNEDNSSMFGKKDIDGGRGAGIFFSTRLDYVEKLQNYDWMIVDLNIFDVNPEIRTNKKNRNDLQFIESIFYELTRLTQEHYILGYPYPLAEAHNFVTLKNGFRDEMVNRVKLCLYEENRLDHVDIENLFIDIHSNF